MGRGISVDADRPVRAAVFDPDDFGIGQLFWAIRDAVVVGDAETGRIVLWNPAAEALFGYSAAEILGRSLDILVPKDLRARHRLGLARFAATGSGPLIDAGKPVELPARRRGGGAVVVELSLTPIAEARRPGRFVLAVIRDATQRKRAEAEHHAFVREQAAREQAERAVRDRDLFLSSVSHDLRTPLAGVKLRIHLLRRQLVALSGAEAPAIGRGIEKIEQSVDRMTRLIAELLDAAHLSAESTAAAKRERVDLVDLVDLARGRRRAAGRTRRRRDPP